MTDLTDTKCICINSRLYSSEIREYGLKKVGDIGQILCLLSCTLFHSKNTYLDHFYYFFLPNDKKIEKITNVKIADQDLDSD